MSFYEDASLVLVPSGYKTSKVYSAKPTDGLGDLVFSRTADTATRVGPDGLIEKVRTNLLLQSNSFDTTWTTSTATLTGGQAGYDGTNNAWELTSPSSGGNIVQNSTQSGLQTFSVYAKGSVSNGIRLYAFGGVNANVYFNLNLGTVGAIAGSGVTAKIEAVGGGWYRCSISFDQTNTAVRFYTTDNNNANAAGTIYIQDAQLETGDIATDYIATTTAAVSVGPVANVPRLDYLGSSCPRLLLEPQRTNAILWSEQINTTNWPSSSQINTTANALVSPDGYQNADVIIPNTTNANHGPAQNVSGLTSGATYSCSIYAKAQGYSKFFILAGAGTGSGQYEFDLTAGTAQAGATITSVGNGWYRCTAPLVPNSSLLQYLIFISNGSAYSYAGNGTSGIAFWGAQVEAGAYATSYIPTTTAAVTRGKDSAVKSGISSIIGQTEGVIFADVVLSTASQQIAILTSAAGNEANRVQVYGDGTGKIGFLRGDGTAIILSSSTYAIGTRLKIAAAYKANDFVLYINGVLQGSDTSVTAPVSPAVLYWGQYVDGSGFSDLKYNQFLLFKTRLTNAQLAELTTI